jgi:hypothetical protein
MLRQVV